MFNPVLLDVDLEAIACSILLELSFTHVENVMFCIELRVVEVPASIYDTFPKSYALPNAAINAPLPNLK